MGEDKTLSLDDAINSLDKSKQLQNNSTVIGKPIVANHLGDYGLPALPGGDRAGILRTKDEGTKYDEGYNLDIDLNEYRANNQSGGDQLKRGIARLAGSTILKGAQGIASVAALATGAVANTVIAGTNEATGNEGGYLSLENIMNNPLSVGLSKVEDALKDELAIYKNNKYNDLNFAQQLATTSWWADEGADAFAFALSNFIPAGVLGKLGLGAKLATSLGAGLDLAEDAGNLINTGKGLFGTASRIGDKLGKLGKYGELANEILIGKAGLGNPVQFAKNVDLLTQNAFMTSSEALMEAQDTGKTIQKNYLDKNYARETEGLDDEGISEFIKNLPEEEQNALREKKASAMKSTFWANIAALSASNHIEAGLVNKVFGNNAGGAVGALIKAGNGIEDVATRIERKGLQRFFMDTKFGTILRNIPKYAITEGLYEENIQDAIQKVSTLGNSTGKLDYIQDVVKQSIDNLDDKEAWKSIGAGMLIGGLMGTVGAVREKNQEDKEVSKAITNINAARENFLNLKNTLYEKNDDDTIKVDDEGKPVYNIQAITDYTANTNIAKDLTDLHDGFKEANHEQTAKIIKDELFTKFALAHLEAGLGDELMAKVDALKSYKDEDLAQLGFDPIDIRNGNKVGTAQRAHSLKEQAVQIQNDYEQITKTIPQTEENNARINDAAKALSRVRSLNEVVKDLGLQSLQSEVLQGKQSEGHDYNKLIVAIQSRQEALDVAKAKVNISEKTANKIQKTIDVQKETLADLLKTVEDKTNPAFDGYSVDEDGLLLGDDEHSPDAKNEYNAIRKAEQASVAKEEQLEEYNRLTNFKTGAQYFAAKNAAKRQEQINQENTDEDLKSDYQEGDFVQYGQNVGYITPNENGEMTVNGNVINEDFVNKNPDLRKYTAEELEKYKQNSLRAVRRRQIQNRLNLANRKLESLKIKLNDNEDATKVSRLQLEDLQINSENGSLRISEASLAKQIANIQNTINDLLDHNEELTTQFNEVRNTVDSLNQQVIEDPYTIDSVREELAEQQIELDTINSQIEDNQTLLDKLNSALGVFQKLWNKAFPNKRLNLEANNFTYLKAKNDIKATKAEIAEIQAAQNDLIEVKTAIDKKVDFFNSEIKEYELQAAKLEYNPDEKAEVVSQSQGQPTVSLNGPMPDIADGAIFKTAGSHRKKNEKGQYELTNDYSQKIWFKFTEQFNPKNPDGLSLRTVTIDDAEYGLNGSIQNLYQGDDVKYHTKDNVKVIVVNKSNNAINREGSPVFTSLPQILDTQTEPEHFPNFHASNKEIAKQQIESYRNTINTIKQSDKPLFLQIAGKSNGKIVIGEPISARQAFGENLPLKIITDDLTTIGGKDYPLPKGLVYVTYNGQPVASQNRVLTPLEAKATLNKLKEYAKLRGNKEAINNGSILKQIVGTVFLGKNKLNPQFSLYFVDGSDSLAFGNSAISTDDLISGKYDEQLENFLGTVNHQVDAALLKANDAFTDVKDKQWKSYSDYLLSGEDAPLLFKIVPKSESINEPQFYNTYLNFSPIKNSTEEVKPQAKASQTQIEIDVDNFSFTDLNGVQATIPINEQVSQPIDSQNELDRIRAIPDSEKRKAAEIEYIMREIAKTADKASADKMQEYTQRILDGQSRDSVIQGLPKSFVDGIDALLKANETTITPADVQDNLLDDLFLEQSRVQDFKQADLDLEEKWFKENISSAIPFSRIKGLIDGKAYGKFTSSGSVLISDAATEGTAYHEAFHVVSQLYLNDKERSGLYSQWRTDNKGEHTDVQVEEALAEEFREYVLTKESPYKSWFSKIVDFIKGILNIGNSDKETLFERISSGYFRERPIISKSDLNLYSTSKGLGASTTKDLMDSMTLTLVRGMFKNNFSLNDIFKFNKGLLNDADSNRFSNLYESVFATVTKQMQNANQENSDYLKNEVIPYLNANKRSIQNDHIKYLSKFGINLQTEAEIESPEDHELVKDTLGIISAIEFSAKSNMPNVIKLMIASLPQLEVVDGKRIAVTNNLGLPRLSDYKRNTAILQNELANISGFKEQMYKVRQLSNRIPEFSLLLDQLGVTDGTVTPSNLKDDYFELQSKWRQQFDKAYYTFYLQLYENGNNYLIDANTDKLVNTIRARWEGNGFLNKSAYKVVGGEFKLNPTYFDKTYSKALKGDEKRNQVLSFYKDLGIVFSRPENVDIDLLADKMKALIKKINENEVSSIFDDEAESKGFINDILNEEIKTSFDYSDNQHINPEGKTVYNVSLHNYLSKLAAEINNFGLPQELQWDEETQTGNPLLRNSSWAGKVNNGQEINIVVLEGARVNEQGETGSSTADLTYADAVSQQFTSVLNGIFPFMRAGDKSLEHAFTFNEKAKYQTLDEATQYFSGALADELLSSFMLNVEGVGSQFLQYANVAKDLRIFKGAFSDAVTKEYQDIINNKNITRAEAIQQIDEFANRDDVKAALQNWIDDYTQENKQILIDNNLVSEFGVEGFNSYSLIGVSSELANKFVGKSDSLSEAQMTSLVEQFTFNQLIANIEQTKLFTGDLAFYKDFFKRTSGLTGTGKSTWVGTDVNEWLNENRPREYQRPDGTIAVDKQSDGIINSVVFKDVKTISSYHQEYVDAFVENGMSRERAEDLLSPLLGTNKKGENKGYDEGDAQGYVTLPEYREFLLRTGDWTPTHEIIYPKLIRNEKITKDELGDFISGYPVLKPQYFGKQVGQELFIPTFYKFSVMPLIPAVVKGTNLENLMHTLHREGKGMALFVTGNKVGGKEANDFYDENGQVNLAGLTTQDIDYTNLKVQLDINPKVKDKVIFGTQFRKLVLANLAGKTITINSKKISGDKIIERYSELINKAVELETKNLIDKLGLEQKDDNTFVLKNPEYLRNLLVDEAFSRQAPDNLLEGIKQVLPEEGDTKQFDVLVNRNKIENILMSLVNNSVIKQKVFGDMRVQGATTGFEAKEGLKGRSYADAKNATWFSKIESVDGTEKSLSFYKADKKGTQPMEVYLPHYFKELIGKDVKIEDIDPKLLNLVGYRTPTQGLNSIELIKIKGFLPQEAGNLIVVPSEIVVKAGSDFDIDKLSLFFPNYEMVDGKPQHVSYEGNENNLKGVYNRIQDIAWKTVAVPENFAQLITPNSTGDVEKIAAEVKQFKPQDKSKTDNGLGNSIGWKKNLDIRSAYLLGKAGVGVTALHNVHHVLSQIVKLKTKPEVKIWLDHHVVDGGIDFSKEREFGADPINSYNILENLSAFLNGFVDIAKNPFLKDINATTDTAGVYFYLLRAGVPLRQAIMFMNQPIINDYLAMQAANSSMALGVKDEQGENNRDSNESILKRLFKKYPAEYNRIFLTNANAAEKYRSDIKTSKLESYIKGTENNQVQRQILQDFLQYKEDAQQLSDLIKATTPDTRGTGATMNSAQENIDAFENIKQNSIFENVEKYIDETFIGSFYKAVQKSVKMYAPLFFTENQSAKQELSNIKETLNLSRTGDKEKILNLVKNDLVNFAIQTSPTETVKIMNLGKTLFSGEFSVAKDLAKAKNSRKLANNVLIKALFPLISANSTTEIGSTTSLDNIKMFSKKVDAVDSNLITEAWNELYEINPKLAKKLVTFTILQSGLNNSPVSFTQFIPNERYVPQVDKLLKANIGFEGFTDKFFRNNYREDLLIPKIKKYINTSQGQFTIANGETASIAFPKVSPITGKIIGRDLTKFEYVKAYNNSTKMYELYRNTGVIKDGKRPSVVFERVSLLGDGYNLKEWTDESIILSNRIRSNNTYSVINNIQKDTELNDLKQNFKDDNNKPIC